MSITSQANIDKSAGIVAGHAYTLISVKKTSAGHQLLKIRNPWVRL